VALGGAVALAAGCDPAVRTVAGWLEVGRSLEPAPTGPAVSPERHLLNRAAFGARPGDASKVRAFGIEGWLDRQIDLAEDDRACALRTAFIDVTHAPADLAFEFRPREVERQLVADTVLRAVYSEHALQERMVGFFRDHFHVAIGKSLCRHLTPLHVAALRPHALGDFRALLEASTLSGAMLTYLDGRENAKGAINENHARELLELHTLGVDGGYTQADVREVARVLTGWVVEEAGAPGRVWADATRHDAGDKTVLGRRLTGGPGPEELGRLLDRLVAHPATARYLALELARHFVADDPPEDSVEAARRAFVLSGGQLGPTVRALFVSEGFERSAGRKLRRPFELVVAALRGTGAETHARGDVQRHLAAMGHAPFTHPTPDGAAFEAAPWYGSVAGRWRFALALARGRLDDTEALHAPLDAPFARLVGRAPHRAEKAALDRVAPADRLALVLSSPGFSRC
jgi:uncharacterized protein (DUF1800 family)